MNPNPRTNAGTGDQNRRTPDSMPQADRANGEGDATDTGVDPATELNDEISDDPAVTGVQDGD